MINEHTYIKSSPGRIVFINLLFYFVLLCPLSGKAQNIANFNGRWSYSSDRTSFLVVITQKQSVLSGTHCSTMAGGNKIDCFLDASDMSITGTVTDSNLVTITFKSFFSETSGRATLRKISATQIEWTIIEEPKGEFYLPTTAVLFKK